VGGLKPETARLVKRLFESAMDEETLEHVRVRRYERSDARRGYRNGQLPGQRIAWARTWRSCWPSWTVPKITGRRRAPPMPNLCFESPEQYYVVRAHGQSCQ